MKPGCAPPPRRLRGPDHDALPQRVNVSRRISAWAREHPARVAVRGPGPGTLSFADLDTRADEVARGLLRMGLVAGDRACLFVPAGPELIVITHALFRAGIVPVLIDPGMGRKRLLECVERMQPRAMLGIARAQLARLLFPRAFASVEKVVSVGRWAWGGVRLDQLLGLGASGFEPFDSQCDDEAAILFTSGSTGTPKGVRFTHGMFDAQLRGLERLYDLKPGEVNVACFPLFALFDNALGMTSVFPELDPTRPGRCDPAKVFAAIENTGASLTFGSPAIWRRVLPWARKHGKRFSHPLRITIAGAPVPPWLVAGLRELLAAGGDVHTPYGATEALPVTSICGAELEAGLRERVEAGEGSCVGRAAPGIEIRVIRIIDEPVEHWSAELELAPGEVGEICVRGAVVTPEYRFQPEATRLARIDDADGPWHRMGDVGYIDEDGLLWLLGRKAHRLETERGLLMPVGVENVFNRLPAVHRTALVGVGPRGRERPHLVVEKEPGADAGRLRVELEQQRQSCAGAEVIEGFLFHRGFPVDVRHNAKIHREELKHWAERRVR